VHVGNERNLIHGSVEEILDVNACLVHAVHVVVDLAELPLGCGADISPDHLARILLALVCRRIDAIGVVTGAGGAEEGSVCSNGTEEDAE